MSSPTFRIGTLMLVIAVIAVVLGLLIQAPGLAAVIAIPAAISLIPTLTSTQRGDGRPPSLLDYLKKFVFSLTIICGILIASGAAFFGSCLAVISTAPGQYGGPRFGHGLALGGVVGLAVFVALVIQVSRLASRHSSQSRPRR